MRILRIRRYRANCVLIRSYQIATKNMELSYFETLANTRSEKSKVLEVRIRRLWMREQALKILQAKKELKDGLEGTYTMRRVMSG